MVGPLLNNRIGSSLFWYGECEKWSQLGSTWGSRRYCSMPGCVTGDSFAMMHANVNLWCLANTNTTFKHCEITLFELILRWWVLMKLLMIILCWFCWIPGIKYKHESLKEIVKLCHASILCSLASSESPFCYASHNKHSNFEMTW